MIVLELIDNILSSIFVYIMHLLNIIGREMRTLKFQMVCEYLI